jgi:hypothetical protein
MDTTTLLAIAVVVLLLVIAAGVAWYATDQRRRRDRLRDRFGPEYERTVEDVGNRRRAEEELEVRAARVEKLEIRRLGADEQRRFAEEWRVIQTRFVDEPSAAVDDADHLVGEVMEARGYPVADFDQRAADVSVDHPQVVDHYRIAHDIAVRERANGGDTEALRQAIVHYRALFADLLETDESEPAEPAHSAAAEPASTERRT